jgi:hypothetical protein
MSVCLETEEVVKGGELTVKVKSRFSKQLPGYYELGGIILMNFWVPQ